MVTNKRYANHYDGLMDAGIAEGIMCIGEPTLSTRDSSGSITSR